MSKAKKINPSANYLIRIDGDYYEVKGSEIESELAKQYDSYGTFDYVSVEIFEELPIQICVKKEVTITLI